MNQMQPIEPSRQLIASLTQEQWNVVLGHLDAGQHRIVRPIIDSLVQQLQHQSTPQRLNTDELQQRFNAHNQQDADNA